MNKIIGAIIGLLGAIGNQKKSDKTDMVIMKALAFCGSEQVDRAKAEEIYRTVVAEKNKISPSCSSCGMPCGSTSDFDMASIEKRSEDEQVLIKEMIDYVCEIAVDFVAMEVDLDVVEIIVNQMYVCLWSIGQNLSLEELNDEFGVMKILSGYDEEDAFDDDFEDDDFGE